MRCLYIALVHHSVVHGGFDLGVAQQFLHLLDGHAFVDCVRGQRASELMRMYPTNLGFLTQCLDSLLDRTDAQPLRPPIERHE